MTLASVLLLAGMVQATGATAAPRLDALMLDVTEACVLPDLRTNDPRPYLASHDWRATDRRWMKRFEVTGVFADVRWPASSARPAACSFSSPDISASEAYHWFRRRIGEPADIPWDERMVAGWRITTNGHQVGIYVSRENVTDRDRPGLLLHVLQN